MKNENNGTTTPAHYARLNHIRVTTWRNFSSDNAKKEKGEKPGRVWFNTVLTRRYLDKASGEYRDSQTLNGLADLALAAEGIRLARQFIVEQQANGDNEGEDSEM